MPTRMFLLCLVLLAIFTGCKTSQDDGETDAWIGQLVAYKKVVSERHGIVGYIKVFEFKKEEFGEAYQLYRILDLNFVERGILYPRGQGLKFVDVAPEVARVTGATREEIELGPQPLELNLAKILEVDLPLKVYKASAADLERPTAE